MITGKPLDNCVIYIVNKEMRLVPQGEVGELVVAGKNLATGYIRDNESRKFQDNPHAIDLGKNFTVYFTNLSTLCTRRPFLSGVAATQSDLTRCILDKSGQVS